MSTKEVTNPSRRKGCSEAIHEVSIHQPRWDLLPGHFIWVQTSKRTWWPAQVVVENSINESNKPRKKPSGGTLVRLYGSYQYVYVDPRKCQTEFEIVLKQNGDNYAEILNKALEKDISSVGSDASKTRGPKTKAAANSRAAASKKALCQNGFEANHSSAPQDSEPSPRRMRVMQSLGLMAPPDSPFRRFKFH